MSGSSEEVISAQVIMRPANGRTIPPNAAITAETLASYLPSQEAARRVREFFQRAGLKVGDLIGISFSITGSMAAFQSLFDVGLQREGRGGIKAAKAGGSPGYELPLEQLPADIRAAVSAVTFTPPPDFGPTEF